MARNKDPMEVDKVIGRRIQELRHFLGMSRHQLAQRIGVTHQQTQKYEKGLNRISAGRLVDIARALNKPVEYFFQESLDDIDLPTEHRRMCIQVSRNFMQIKNPASREAINTLIKVLAAEEAA